MADKALFWALRAGIAVPFIYFGIQALAAPFFPGFSVLRTTASELGSDMSEHASIFNAGIMAQGVVTLVVSAGFFLAFRRLDTGLFVASFTSAAVAINGLQTLWAGYHPIPDPRHGGHPVFVVAMILLPLLLTFALWRQGGRWLRSCLVAALVLLAAMVPLMSGLSGLDTHQYRGLLQRVFTLTIFPPIGVAAYVLASRLQQGQAAVVAQSAATE